MNVTKLQKMIDEVQTARITARIITAHDVVQAIHGLEDQLRGRLMKKDWKGLKFKIDLNAQKFPNAYKGIPESTVVWVERTAASWKIIRVCRFRTDTLAVRPINLREKAAELALFAAEATNWN